MELEVGLLAGWVRFWHRGELLPLPGELMCDLKATQEKLAAASERADDERRRADTAEKQLAELRAKLANGKNGSSP